MEDSSEIRNRSDYFSQSYSRSPKSSMVESQTDILTTHRKRKHISFYTPLSLGESKNSTLAHSRHQSESFTPLTRIPMPRSVESKQKENPLWRLKEKFNRITEELDTARETGKETGRETLRENNKESIVQDLPVQALHLSSDYEFKGYPTLRWCAYCAKETTTEITYKNTSKTFFSSLGIFLAGGVFGCFLLPYLGTTCKQHAFLCHKCKHEVGATF